jgi:DNA-directed RNA polymerase subunit L
LGTGKKAYLFFLAIRYSEKHSAEAAIALRQRLNETVDQLEALRKAHTELEVNFESQSKELTIAKSDRQ